MRQTEIFPTPHPEQMRRRILHWAAQHPYSAVLYGGDAPSGPVEQEWALLAGVGAAQVLACPAGGAFDALVSLQLACRDWLFGYFAYDLKNETEALHSSRPDAIGFPDLLFWIPQMVVGIRGGHLEIHALGPSPREVLTAILSVEPDDADMGQSVVLQPRISRASYLESVEAIRQHIIDGDVYELNFCQEFWAEGARIRPLAVFERLMGLSNAPFSAWLRAADRYALCASPERFLKHQNGRLYSQPIKGTRGRGADAEDDARIRAELQTSEKDRAENVMIVDLVRNDLARNCLPGSVVVDELFGIYTFQTVHQMISTVQGRLRPGVHPLTALRDAFPMGSMTGAPKVMAMTLIEQYESSRRGLYSGAIGYIAPNGDFDFNVVIRTILYHAGRACVSASVGGAIVYDSRPEEEYEECMVKVNALKRALMTPE